MTNPQPSSSGRSATGIVHLVGAGPGDPGLITVRGRELVAQADVIVYDRLANPRLLQHARASAEIYYVGKHGGGQAVSQEEINTLLVGEARAGKTIVRLKGGDPFVFGRGAEEAEELVAAGIPFTVVPGVTSAIAAPAYAGIPVTHRSFTSAFLVATGHEDPAKVESTLDWPQLTTAAGTLVFLMGVENLPYIVQELMANGRDPATPAALVRWGTRPDQRTLTSTLSEIVAAARAAKLRPPAVLIVGEVIQLRDRLRWFDTRPLFGKRVLVTRTREQASALVAKLEAQGAEAIELPAIAIEPIECFDELDAAIDRLAGRSTSTDEARGIASAYDWVIFTSANGVAAFGDRAWLRGFDARIFGQVRIAAIGPATARALESRGLRADYVPTEYVAEAVATGLIERGVAGQRALLPRAAAAREALAVELRHAGADVDEVAVYRTVVPAGNAERARQLIRDRAIDIVTFTASSTVTHLLQLLDDAAGDLNEFTIACIGPITARTAAEKGLRVDVSATEYTIDGLVTALVDHVQTGE